MRIPVATIVIAVLVILGLIVLFASAYTIFETEQVIITQFGEPMGEPITEPGLNFKTPFIQQVNRLEKRILEWDGDPNEIPTKDKTYVAVDTFARWRISDPLLYFQRLRDEISAQSRLDDILDGETRNAIAKHNLIEMIRTTKDRQPLQDESLEEAGVVVGKLPAIRYGRTSVEEEIFTNAAPKLVEVGIELLDIRFKRINYNQNVQKKIYDRMISERQQIAERFRSEGAGRAASIKGEKERDLEKIESEAYKKIQTIKGDADAKATEIYANAYNQSPEAVAFYDFTKTMETYQVTIDKESTLILTTDSDLYKLLKGIDLEDRPPFLP